MELSLQVHAVRLNRGNNIPFGPALNAAATAMSKVNKT
jgi:prepilin signal peptidase PulO-like enzyme (type II secretory pathway)